MNLTAKPTTNLQRVLWNVNALAELQEGAALAAHEGATLPGAAK